MATNQPSRYGSDYESGRDVEEPQVHALSPSVHNTRIRVRDEEPPLYQVDLSLPPESRYIRICEDYKEQMANLVQIYDSLLSFTPFPRLIAFIAKKLLKKVRSSEETREIRGISIASGMPVHLVVAYNTFLDLFSGCMSGGAQVKVPRVPRGTRMVHFRNLDWDMEPLRDMIIRVEYLVGGTVVARAVTYAGYIGVLTGVREGLSLSMNYRARVRAMSSTYLNRVHHLRILLGYETSIASQLRQILLSSGPPPTLEELSSKFDGMKASSCYLTFCTPSSVLIVENDLNSAVSHTSDEFLAVTNHDVSMEAWTPERWREFVNTEMGTGLDGGGVKAMMEESIDRKECMCKLWREKGRRRVTLADVKSWLRTYPVRNECTHFSCIMDPSVQGGGLLWVETCELDDG